MWPAKYSEIPEQHLFSDQEIQDMVNVMQDDGNITTDEQATVWRKLVQAIRYSLELYTTPRDEDAPPEEDDDDVIPC